MLNFNTIIANESFILPGAILLYLAIALLVRYYSYFINSEKEALIKIFKKKNCGICGFKKCRRFAGALLKGKADINKCSMLSESEKTVVLKILGKNTPDEYGQTAVIMCNGGIKSKNNMDYTGIKKCYMSDDIFEGSKECKWGCLGYGDCVSACPFNAISFTKEGEVPLIDQKKCTGCGECLVSCPKQLIKLVPDKFKFAVLCSSKYRGQNVKNICDTGCISCGICVRICQPKDIILENNVAKIKYVNCNNCSICFHKCPTKSIREKNPALTAVP
jgi:Na+-translocating ferredoxin:NAD+ oxidoreductase subunit B